MQDIHQRIRDIQHFGEEGGVVPVIDVASTSTFLNPEDMERAFHGEMEGCYLYSRHSNPSVNMFSKKMAALEGMEFGLGTASGMSAISSALEQIMGDGGEIISSLTVYGGTYALFKNVFPQQGIQVKFVNIEDLQEVERAITPRTKVIYTETLSNPLLRVSPLQKLGDLCRKRNIKLVVDNTFTPMLINPSVFGADVVVHSCTKFISGASDLIAGVVLSSKKFIHELIDLNHGRIMLKGPVMDPRIAHELYLRLDHLPIRMKAHSAAAQYFAENVEKAGIKIIYPGLKSHNQHDLMKSMMNPGYGFGGMMAIDMKESKKAMRLAQRLQDEKFGLYAVSLGFSRTLMSCPSVSTSSEITAEDLAKMNLSPGLLRLSIGFVGDHQIMLERFVKCYRECEKHNP